MRILKVLGSSARPLHADRTGGLRRQSVPRARPVSEHPLREARPERSDLHLPGRRGRRGDLVRHQQESSLSTEATSGCARRVSRSTASPWPRLRRPACGTSGGSSPRPWAPAASPPPNDQPHKPPWTRCRTRTSRSSSRRSPLAGPRTSRRRAGLASSREARTGSRSIVFWVPWLAAEPYIWLNMTLTATPERHVLARDHTTRPARRQADQERPKREPTLGRHDVALAVRAGTGQEGPRDPGRPRRRRADKARRNVRGAQEREPQASPELAAIKILHCRATLIRDEAARNREPQDGVPRPGRSDWCLRRCWARAPPRPVGRS